MLLGKRPRPTIRRTTSMTGITMEAPEASDLENPMINGQQNDMWVPQDLGRRQDMLVVGTTSSSEYLMAMVSPRNNNKRSNSSSDGINTVSHFLTTCCLCRRRLSPGRDIYMYRGDTAFCSLECREEKMKHDEREERDSTASSVSSTA